MAAIAEWRVEFHMDYTWHVSRFNVFDFQLGYDFFFKQLRDVAMFRLAWGGTLENYPVVQFQLYYQS